MVNFFFFSLIDGNLKKNQIQGMKDSLLSGRTYITTG